MGWRGRCCIRGAPKGGPMWSKPWAREDPMASKSEPHGGPGGIAEDPDEMQIRGRLHDGTELDKGTRID